MGKTCEKVSLHNGAKEMKRLLIYFIYDEDGIVDRYILYALEKLRPFSETIMVVANGKLNEESSNKLHRVADHVLVRENIGFDVWAYKSALAYYGWDVLTQYDEVILMNYTIVGPVYDLSAMFEEMDGREVDFWGITKCFREDSPEAVEIWGNKLGFIPEHIQSSFMAFRNALVKSDIFQNMWNEMPMIHSYYEAGGYYEQNLTKYLSEQGYTWSCYTDYSNITKEDFGCCPLITAPLYVIRTLKSPFFKRRTFFTSKLENPVSIPFAHELWNFLEKESEYDTDLIYENLIRGCNQRDIAEALQLLHIL